MKNIKTIAGVYAKYAEKFLKYRERKDDISIEAKFYMDEDTECVEFHAWGIVNGDTTAITITDVWRGRLTGERLTPAGIKRAYEDAVRRIEDYLSHKEERIAKYIREMEDEEEDGED